MQYIKFMGAVLGILFIGTLGLALTGEIAYIGIDMWSTAICQLHHTHHYCLINL